MTCTEELFDGWRIWKNQHFRPFHLQFSEKLHDFVAWLQLHLKFPDFVIILLPIPCTRQGSRDTERGREQSQQCWVVHVMWPQFKPPRAEQGSLCRLTFPQSPLLPFGKNKLASPVPKKEQKFVLKCLDACTCQNEARLTFWNQFPTNSSAKWTQRTRTFQFHCSLPVPCHSLPLWLQKLGRSHCVTT